MRYYEIHEPLSEKSVRMGAKDLAKTDLAGVLVGFEFELAHHYDEEQEWEDFKSSYPTPDIADWFDDFNVNVLDFVQSHAVTPKYGYADDDEETVYDQDGDERQIANLSFMEFDELFHFPNTIYDEFDLVVEERMREEFEYDHGNMGKERAYEEVKEYILNNFPHYIREDSDKVTIGTSYWSIAEDSSIKPGGAEIVSPPMPAVEAIAALHETFDFIKNSYLIETNESTGLHVNVSVAHPEAIDILKLALLMGEDHLLRDWGREGNAYSISLLSRFVDALQDSDLTDIHTLIREMNTDVKETAVHHMSIDVTKLANGYLEFRATGGSGYEKRGKDVENLVKKYVRLIQIASDPMAEREAYLKKLSVFVSENKTVDAIPYSDLNLTKEDIEDAFPDMRIDGSLHRTQVWNYIMNYLVPISQKEVVSSLSARQMSTYRKAIRAFDFADRLRRYGNLSRILKGL